MNPSPATRPPKKLVLALLAPLALLLFCAAPLRAQTYGPFFSASQFIGYDEIGYAVYYLPTFGYFTYLGQSPDSQPYPGYLYKYNFGYLYSFGNSGGSNSDAYFYDFGQSESLGYFYVSSDYDSGPDDYLYMYVFSPYNAFMVYFQDTYDPRVFYNFTTDDYVYLN